MFEAPNPISGADIMKHILFILLIIPLIIFNVSGAVTAQSLDLTGVLDDTRDDFNAGIREGEQIAKDQARRAAERAAERSRNRDNSNDFCYSIENQNAQNACLEMPYAVTDSRAQNILLGNCYAFNTNSDLSRSIQYICAEGRRGCTLLDDSTAAYHCDQCGGTRRWIATYSLGTIIQCFK